MRQTETQKCEQTYTNDGILSLLNVNYAKQTNKQTGNTIIILSTPLDADYAEERRGSSGQRCLLSVSSLTLYLQVSLVEFNAKNAQFRILPRYKVKSEGEVVSRSLYFWPGW